MNMNLVYLFLAFFLVWGAAAGYLCRLSSLRADLDRRVRRLEETCRPAPGNTRPG
jgi:CcmD family protein